MWQSVAERGGAWRSLAERGGRSVHGGAGRAERGAALESILAAARTTIGREESPRRVASLDAARVEARAAAAHRRR